VEYPTPLALEPGAGNRGARTWVVPARPGRHGDQQPAHRAPVPADREGLKRATLDARNALQEAALAAAVAAQRAFAYAEKLDEALAALQRTETAAPALPPSAAISSESLSPREKEVLTLVAEGRSNKAIADALFVSPNTIKTHVASLLHKLHADSRAQLAAMAVRGAFR
jgi:DNA-binding NarL/FixJ family response regulator